MEGFKEKEELIFGHSCLFFGFVCECIELFHEVGRSGFLELCVI